jgi:hypothetical protein
MTLLLHIGHYWFLPQPTESHHWFGAGFLFVGVLLIVECIAGGVWFRSRLRTAIWPVVAMSMGEGLIIVSFLDPNERIIHFTVGALVLAAGWQELRFRFSKTSRFSANLLVVPAWLASGFEMGVVHGKGDAFTAVGHMAMGLTVAMMAGVRLYQAQEPRSIPRSMLTGFLVITLALILLIFQP